MSGFGTGHFRDGAYDCASYLSAEYVYGLNRFGAEHKQDSSHTRIATAGIRRYGETGR